MANNAVPNEVVLLHETIGIFINWFNPTYFFF